MERPISRLLAGAEMTILLMPLTLIAVLAGVPFAVAPWVNGAGWSASSIGVIIVLPLALAAVVAHWRVLGCYVIYGPQSLARVHRTWWFLLIVGAVLTIAPELESILFGGSSFNQKLIEHGLAGVVIVGAFGNSLLIPLAHVTIERWFYLRSNNRCQQF